MNNTSPSAAAGDAVRDGLPLPVSPGQNPGAPSEVYSVVRKQIEHVNNNLSQRVIWLVIAQSFFFGAYAAVVTGKEGAPEQAAKFQALLTILPIAAMLAVAITYVDVVASLIYMRDLRRAYELSPKDDTTDSCYPLIHGKPFNRVLQHISPALLPAMFIAVWAYILMSR